jgi:cell division protein FtsB
MARASGSPRRRPARPRLLGRWLAVGVLTFVGFLYYQPLRSYLETRHALAERSAEVRALAAQREALERRLAAQTSNAALLREARRLTYVKPGERLFIVKGIPAWRRAHLRDRPPATIGADG